jgi:putative colanic acid biosynthesis acetyltransferase WcaB
MLHEMSLDARGQSSISRFLTALFRGGSCVIISYRIRRFIYLATGRYSAPFLILVSPILIWCRMIGGRHEFPKTAEIGRGLRLVHAVRSCVVNGQTIAGENLYMTGGNTIGVSRAIKRGDLVLGDSVLMGIGAMVIGPLTVGSSVRIGAGTVVVKNVPDGSVVVGNPARVIQKQQA